MIEHLRKGAGRLQEALGGQPHRLYGSAMLRIFSGGTAAWYMLSDYGQRAVLWGPGRVDLNLQGTSGELPIFHLYEFTHGVMAFNLLFHAGLVVAVAFAVFGGRAWAAAHAVLFLSLCNTAPSALQGGENLEQLLVLLLPFMITNAYFSPLARRGRRRLTAIGRTDQRWFRNATHNTAILLAVFQICVLYLVAGLWKIVGDTWRDGTALFYILHSDQSDFFGPLTRLMDNAMLTTLGSYLAIALEVLFPWIVLARNGWVRKIGIGMVECMHVGIIVGMGLVVFGMIMVGADLAVLRDSDYEMLARAARRIRPTVDRRLLWRPRVAAEGSGSAIERHAVADIAVTNGQ